MALREVIFISPFLCVLARSFFLFTLISPLLLFIFRVVLLFKCNYGWKLSHLPFFDFKEMDCFNKNLQWGVQEISKRCGKPQMRGAVSSPFAHLGGSGPLGVSEQGLKQPQLQGEGQTLSRIPPSLPLPPVE